MSPRLTTVFKELAFDHLELLGLFSSYFGTSRSTPEGHVVYPAIDNYVLHVRSDADEIIAIDEGPGFSEKILDELYTRAKQDLIDSPGTIVARDFLFCSRAVNGYFQSNTAHIQVIPPPPNAPKPNCITGQHPFVLEFPVKKSLNGFITNSRRIRGRMEWAWVLNAILKESITFIGPRTRHFWGLLPKQAEISVSTQENVRWTQESYDVDNFQHYSDIFSEVAWPPIRLIGDGDYYSNRVVNDELEIPVTLDQLLGRFVALTTQQRERFLGSAQLVCAAKQLWDSHVSSYYGALIQAIEALAWAKLPQKKCKQCGRNSSPGSTKLFKAFVNHYAPSHDNTICARLYAIRSALVHGHYSLQIDEKAWAFAGLYSKQIEQTDALGAVRSLVRDVQIAWLKNPPNPPDDWWKDIRELQG